MTRRLTPTISLALVMALLVSILVPAFGADAPKADSIVISSFTNTRGDVSISAGKAEGIQVGATGMVMRDGKKIADYKVAEVNWGMSWILLSNVASAETVRVGDSAPLTSAPAPAKPKKKSSIGKILIGAAVVALAAILISNGHDGGGSPDNSAITLDATKTTTYGDDKNTSTVTITAYVKNSDGNTATDGTSVTFSSTVGTLNHTSATTTGGKATATLTADTTAGTAVVTVRSLGKTANLTVSFANSIDLTASPSLIYTTNSGGSPTQTTITATCRDAYGNLASSGTVKFSTTVGTLAYDEVAFSNGVATTTLTSSSAGKGVVTAAWSNTSATADITVKPGPPYALTVSSSSASLQCDGSSYATITATVKDKLGNSVADGTVVDFSVTADGTGGGNGTITAQATTTSGTAKATLYTKDESGAKSTAGTATVRAQVLAASQPSDIAAPVSDLSATTSVRFVSTTVAEIHLGASPTNIRGWDTVGNTSTITAVVYTSDRSPVPDGTTVTFSATHGMITSTAKTTNGTATTTLTSDASGSDSWTGLVDVTATAGGVSTTGTGLVIFSGPPSPSKCTATMSQTTLAKSGGQATVIVTAKDKNGNTLADGTTVTAVTSKGTISPASATTSNGVVQFTVSTSADSATPTEPGSGTVTISIASGATNPETGGLPVTLTLDFTVSN